MTDIKPIETVYKGYRFRSRLEARWAVFFDELGVKWDYEKEGYDLGEAGWYLPDFYLPTINAWIEIKGQDAGGDAIQKCKALRSQLGESGTIELMILGGEIGLNILTNFCEFSGNNPERPDEWFPSLKTHLKDTPKVILFEGGFSDLKCWLFLDNRCIEMQSMNVLFGVLLDKDLREYTSAIRSACSARFEHGESGNTKRAANG